MIRVAHPTGNTFVRALLRGLESRGLLEEFHTTIGRAGSGGGRRVYPVAAARLRLHPAREIVRLALSPLLRQLGRPGELSRLTDWVYAGLDHAVAKGLEAAAARGLKWVYAYEDGALETFRAAERLGIARAYDLPIAYWETTRSLLEEEARRRPDWAATLGSPDDPEEKLARKTAEIGLADVIICPSLFVLRSLPKHIRARRHVVLARFGAPALPPPANRPPSDGPLRVLFAGTLSQRKGLADLFDAVKLLGRGTVSLTLLGAALMPMEFYRARGPEFDYAAPRDHAGVLGLMRTMDVLVLPSIVEGRALVQQEAMACGLPVIATPNAGAEDLITDGETGFLVPVRDPETLAARLQWCAGNRGRLREMGREAARRAAALTWEGYADEIIGRLTTPAAPGHSAWDGGDF